MYKSESDFDGDGIIDYQDKNTTNNVYDNRGNLIRSVRESEFDNDGDGIIDYQDKNTTNNVYDKRDNLISSVSESESDFDGDGIIDSRRIYNAIYDCKNKLSGLTVVSDKNADNLIDEVSHYQQVLFYGTDSSEISNWTKLISEGNELNLPFLDSPFA